MSEKLGVIIIVGGSEFSVPAVQCAHELGLKAVVVDKNPDAPAMKVADFRMITSINDPVAILKIWHVRGSGDGLRAHGIMSVGHDVEQTVAIIAKELNLPGIPPEVANRTKNKGLTRTHLDKAGIPTPKWGTCYLYGQALQLVSYLHDGFVIKPTTSQGSRGASVVKGKNAQLPFEMFQRARNGSASGEVIIEELMEGPEQSVEILLDGKGKSYRMNITDRIFNIVGGIPMEVGHVTPSALPKKKQKALYELAEEAAKAIGVDWGPFKLDTIFTSTGPMILEAASRLSGGFDSSHSQMITGRNPIKAVMKLSMGVTLSDIDFPAADGYAACFAPLSGDEEHCADRKEFRIARGNTWHDALSKAKKGIELEYHFERKP